MSRSHVHRVWYLGAIILLVAFGCGGGGGSGGSTAISFVVPAPGGAAALTATDGSGNSLIFESVEIVLREVEFEFQDSDDDCGSPTADDDDCEEVERGPLLVDLALDGSTRTEIRTDLPPGFYEEVEFELHKVSSEDDEDAAFLNNNPDFVDISVRVVGTYNGNSFEFTSDVDAEQELEFDPPFEVVVGEPANVTISIDVDSWFRNGADSLVDPATAGNGGPNESLVENNIAQSFDAFEDDDEDDDEDDEDDEDED